MKEVLLLWESVIQTEHHIWHKNHFCLIKGWRLCEAGAVSLGRSTMSFVFLIKNGISLTLSVVQFPRIFSMPGLKSSPLKTKELRLAAQVEAGEENWLSGVVGSGELVTAVPVQK